VRNPTVTKRQRNPTGHASFNAGEQQATHNQDPQKAVSDLAVTTEALTDQPRQTLGRPAEQLTARASLAVYVRP
jgi:hypothetical protein